MTTHDPKKRTNRQRDSRKQVNKAARADNHGTEAAICRTYNRSGMDGVDAIGGGCVEQWDTDSERGQGDE